MEQLVQDSHKKFSIVTAEHHNLYNRQGKQGVNGNPTSRLAATFTTFPSAVDSRTRQLQSILVRGFIVYHTVSRLYTYLPARIGLTRPDLTQPRPQHAIPIIHLPPPGHPPQPRLHPPPNQHPNLTLAPTSAHPLRLPASFHGIPRPPPRHKAPHGHPRRRESVLELHSHHGLPTNPRLRACPR